MRNGMASFKYKLTVLLNNGEYMLNWEYKVCIGNTSMLLWLEGGSLPCYAF